MNCVKCGKEFTDEDGPRAGISIIVTGDEYVYTYVLCSRCSHYTVRAYHDRFMGEDSVEFLPPLEKSVGDRAVGLISRCPNPYDKNCECPSHRALYYGVPAEEQS